MSTVLSIFASVMATGSWYKFKQITLPTCTAPIGHKMPTTGHLPRKQLTDDGHKVGPCDIRALRVLSLSSHLRLESSGLTQRVLAP